MIVMKTFLRIAFRLGRLYWFIFRPKTQGVKCVIEHNGKYLYIRNSYGKGRWTFPGGGIKRKESPEEATRREVYEEVGLVLNEMRPLGSFVNTTEYKVDTIYCFHANVDSSKYKTDNFEIEEAKWASQLPQPLSPVVKKILDKVSNKA